MLNQNFHQVLVASTQYLPTTGTTVNLGYGQIGIFDADTYQATNTPSYLKNKGIIFAQGVKDLPGLPKGAGIANETEKTKAVLGRKIVDWKGKKAQVGQTMKVAIGYDGVDITKTIEAKPGDIKYLYLKLTGKPITDIFPGGIIKQYQYQEPCIDGCTDNGCTSINPTIVAEAFRKQIDADQLISGNPLKNYVRVTTMSNCTTPPDGITLVPFDQYQLTLTDDGSDYSLGLVQAEYAAKVTKVSRSGLTSVYQLQQTNGASAPAAFTNAGAAAIPNCATCPTGFTYNASLKVFQVNQPAATAAPTGLPGQQGSAVLVSNNFGFKVYEVFSSLATSDATFAAAVNAITGAASLPLGPRADVCILTSPTTTAWTAIADCNKATKVYQLTLRDTECGTSRLTNLQSFYVPIYGTGSVVELDANATYCMRDYQLTIQSDDCYAAGCTDINWNFTPPPAFEGVDWKQVIPTDLGEGCVAGLLFESAFVSREENKCYFDLFPYNVDGIHIEVSEHNPDWHGSVCETDWPVTVVQEFKYPSGNGRYVAREEIKSRMYHFKYFNDIWHLAERAAEGGDIVTRLDQYYDEYNLVFDFSYSVLGWSEIYNDRYQVTFYFPTGTGKNFEAAVNTYVTSVPNSLDPVVL